MKIEVPQGAADIIRILQENGHEAYIVGGCVRDSLMGKTPHDFDICTNANPGQVYNCIWDTYKIVESGIKHGTVTVITPTGSYEVTTYRIDGEYTDGRRPDFVEFVADLFLDLSRRDFTINAIAYSEDKGMIDLFGGMDDLKNRVIRCVGDAGERFNEDALRILRALRFSSTLGFSIEEETRAAIHKMSKKLSLVSAERITDELVKLLAGDNACSVLIEYSDVFAEIIPELKPCIGFDQNNRFHQYTVYDHIAHAVSNYKGRDPVVSMSLLLHDIGKPHCYTENEKGGHFYGHCEISYKLARNALSRLRFDKRSTEDILELVRHHDAVMEPNRRVVKRWLNRIGTEQFTRLLDIRIADILAHAEGTYESRVERWRGLCDELAEVCAEMQCFSLKDLDVNGHDIMALGIGQGELVGRVLNALLDRVIDEELENDKDILLESAKSLLSDAFTEFLCEEVDGNATDVH